MRVLWLAILWGVIQPEKANFLKHIISQYLGVTSNLNSETTSYIHILVYRIT